MSFTTRLFKWFTGRLRNNLFLKVLSLIISIFIWLWIQANEEKSISAKLVLNYKLPEGLVEVAEAPKAILLEIQGSKGRIRQLDNTILYTTIDLSDSIKGTNTIDLSLQSIDNTPEGIVISRYIPPVLDIILDKPMVRDVQIKPNLVGSPAKGWKITSVNIEPKSVPIRGARQLLKNLTEVTTQVINIDKISETKIFNSSISLPSKTLIPQNKEQLKVTVEVSSTDLKKEFKEVTILLNSADKIIEPPTATVIISFPKDQLQELPESLGIIVDEKKLLPQASEVIFTVENQSPFSIQGADDIEIEIVSILPEKFTLKEVND